MYLNAVGPLAWIDYLSPEPDLRSRSLAKSGGMVPRARQVTRRERAYCRGAELMAEGLRVEGTRGKVRYMHVGTCQG